MPVMPNNAKGEPQVEQLDYPDWIKQKTNWIESDNESEQWQRWRKWNECLKFYEGKQLIQWDITTESYQEGIVTEDDPYYTANIYRAFVNAVLSELIRAQSQFLVAAKTDKPHDIDAAMSARMVLLDGQRRIWTAYLNHRVLLFLLLYGNAWLYTCWIKDAGPMVDQPQVNMQQIPFGQTSQVCQDCGAVDGQPVPDTLSAGMPPGGASLPPEMAGQACPTCASPNIQTIGSDQPLQVPQMSTTKVRGGEGQTSAIDPTQLKVHLHSRRIEETPYLEWTCNILKDEAEAAFPGVKFAVGGNRDQHRWEREGEASAGNVSGMGAMGFADMGWGTAYTSDLVILKRYWMRPVMYKTYAPPKDIIVQTQLSIPGVQQNEQGQSVIPAGTKFIDIFPNGYYLCMNQANVIDMRPEAIEDVWVHIVYHMVISRIWGDGTEDLIQQAREYNEKRSIDLENDMHTASPSAMFNPKKFKRGTMSGKARRAIPMENARPDDKPMDYVFFPQPRSMSPMFYQSQQGIKGDMQLMSAAPVGDSGVPGSTSNTATGMSIIRDWTASKLAVHLDRVNEGKMKWAQQYLAMCQKYWTGDRYMRLANENGTSDGQWFSAADIRGDFDITIKPGSAQPRSQMQEKDDLLQFMSAGGVPFGGLNPAMPKPAAVKLAQYFGFPLDLEPYTVQTRKQRWENDNIKNDAVAWSAQGMDAMSIAQQIAVSHPVSDEDDDQAHIDEINRLLLTDAGWTEDPNVKAAWNAHKGLHKMQMMKKQAEQMQMAMMSGAMPGAPGAMLGGGPAPGGGAPSPASGGSSAPAHPGGPPSGTHDFSSNKGARQ